MASIVPTQWPGRLEPRRSWPDRLSGKQVPVRSHSGLFFFRTPALRLGFRKRRGRGARRTLGGGSAGRGRTLQGARNGERRRERGLGDRGRKGGVAPISRTRRNTARPAGRGGRDSAPEAPRLPRARLAGRDCLPAEVDVTPSLARLFSQAPSGVSVF